MSLFEEFKPALMFLGKFLAIYLVGNVLYGLYIESNGHEPDPITFSVTAQSAGLLNAVGYDCSYANVPDQRKVALYESGAVVLNVFEGCNGLNVMIVFVAFLLAFGGPWRGLLYFLPTGLVVIHLFNLLRIHLLFHLALNDSDQFYYYHKYFFTASLYLVVLGLWALWIYGYNGKRNARTAQ